MNTRWILLLTAALSGCLKEELPVPAHQAGDAITGQACVGTDYGRQVWYDLGTCTVVGTNGKMDWDLAFECGTEGWHVRLNGSRFMRAASTAQTDIALPLDTTGYGGSWRVDHAAGAPDSTAIGDWRAEHPILVLDLGYTTAGLPAGVRQLRILSVNADGYAFEMSKLDGTDATAFQIAKDPARSYVHFSVLSGTSVPIAPPLGTYDLVFTQYTHEFHDPYQAYLVTGVVNGWSGIRVAGPITGNPGSVALADTTDHPFSRNEDAIGYDWKEYDFDLGTYTVLPERVYIVQDAQGAFLKLHFIDFYNDAGERGCPTFEVEAF